MSRYLNTSLPCWSEDGDSFDWKYFLKPLSVRRTVEAGNDVVTQPDFGRTEPQKCLYHVISQALINQQNDTEQLKSQRVEKLKRKISTKLKPDEFLASSEKVRRLEKSQSMTVTSAPSQSGKSDLLRSVTDPGIQDGRKMFDPFGTAGKSVTELKPCVLSESSETLPHHASTLSLADSGFDEVDAKMASPVRVFRRPQLFVSPMKGRKLKLKTELVNAEDVDINDNFSVLSPPEVKPAPIKSDPVFQEFIEPDSVDTSSIVQEDISAKSILPCPKIPESDVLSFDIVPSRISKPKHRLKQSANLAAGDKLATGSKSSAKAEILHNIDTAPDILRTKQGRLLDCGSHEKDAKTIFEKMDANLSRGADSSLALEDIAKGGVEVTPPLVVPEVKKETAGLEEFHHVEEMYGKYTAIMNLRPDLQNSASRWTIPVLQRYIKKQYVDLIQPMRPTDSCQLTKKERAHLKKQMIDQSILMFSPPRHFTKEYPQFGEFQNWKIQEADIRLFLNVLLRRLCLKLNMQMRVEERITGDGLPNAVCDYAFYKNDVCVGLLEAKSPSGLEPKATPQFLVELLNIQARYGSSDLSVFGILSDAHRFVFINLVGVRFSFEQTEMMQIHIHEVFSWTDLFDVADVILNNFDKHNRVLRECLQGGSPGGADVSDGDDSDVVVLE
ncbi:uncharacterized protein LOC135498376 [Lineus longissimus]|uniref:uncharacterized protein LOC135498376 n=1 Tax=Lineus longissimus TaxID=88925 RepID=UPI00315CDB4D